MYQNVPECTKMYQNVPLDVVFSGNNILCGDLTKNRLESFVVYLTYNMSFSKNDIICVNGKIENFTQLDKLSYNFDIIATLPNKEIKIFLNPLSIYSGTLNSKEFSFMWNNNKSITENNLSHGLTFTTKSLDKNNETCLGKIDVDLINTDNNLSEIKKSDITIKGGLISSFTKPQFQFLLLFSILFLCRPSS